MIWTVKDVDSYIKLLCSSSPLRIQLFWYSIFKNSLTFISIYAWIIPKWIVNLKSWNLFNSSLTYSERNWLREIQKYVPSFRYNTNSKSNILDLNHWRKDSECLCMWFAYNSHAYTKFHKPAASVGFLLKEKKADHCLSEGGEEWRAAAMHGLYDLLKSGTETRPYQELGSSTPTPPTYPPNPNPSGWDSSRCSGKQAIWKTEPVWVTRWYFVLLSFFFWDAYGLKLCVFILNIRGFLFLALI